MTAIEMITAQLDEPATVTPGYKLKSIVVATDGSDAALAAFKAADLISARNDAKVHVLSVLEPMPIMFPREEALVFPRDLSRSREEAQLATAREQTHRFDRNHQWTTELRVGRPSEAIVDYAREQKADLIIIGANTHSVWGRILGEETAMELLRLSDIPLFVASPQMKRLPRRVILAMDLNPDSMQWVPQTLASVAVASSTSCVHVTLRDIFLGVDWSELDQSYQRAMKEKFAALEKVLKKVQINPDFACLHGDPSREITDFADYSKAELIVVGVKHQRGHARAIGGRMAGRIIRHASCSVLIGQNLTS